ncbi:hypothetical protein [Rhodococcus sp. HNM0569]|uniref:hypothetical protein n=1 Tax=Rhodococcus sp. HNM0569 TaxID=2716340 RepID=UPI00146D2720|nr:hypothetical protein [Rhodococcus sp. HNM0569]NLU83774.1 hypothetical protein [Rhodococcus sp. HNM0569]
MDFDSVADFLYGLWPAEFVAERTKAAASAKKAGHRELASEIARLKKPTVTGWALNLLARTQPRELARLRALGRSLSRAQSSLDAARMRSLADERTQLTNTLVTRVAETASTRGHLLSAGVVREVGQTLGAAVADPDVGDRLESGRMLRGEDYSGFGEYGGFGDGAVLASVPDPPENPDDGADAGVAAERQAEERAAAHRAVVDAERALGRARESAARTRAAVDESVTRIRELKSELTRAEQEQRFAVSARNAADKAVRDAEAAVAEARERLDD